MKTNDSTNACPKCGATVPPEAPQGLCPQCVLAAAAAPEAAPTATLVVVFYELHTGELPLGRFSPPSQRTPVVRASMMW